MHPNDPDFEWPTEEDEITVARKVWKRMQREGKHDWLKPHDFLGTGEITKCPRMCPGNMKWKEKQNG
jgi:hypothetical protein